DRLAHLLHPAEITRVDIAILTDGHFEFEILVAAIRHVAAEVPIDSATAQGSARGAERDGVLGGQMRNTLRSLTPDGIVRQQIFILVNLFFEGGRELLDAVQEADR